jgi:hypothetical protein
MKWKNLRFGIIPLLTFLMGFQSIPKDVSKPNNIFRGLAEDHSSVLQESDKIRIKIQRLETLSLPKGSNVTLMAELFICLQNPQGHAQCQPIGNTDGVVMQSQQVQNFEQDDKDSNPHIYSRVVTGTEVNSILRTAPSSLRGQLFLRVELQQVGDSQRSVIRFQNLNFPSLTELPRNSQKILRSQVNMLTHEGDGGSSYGAVINVLIHRPS